jgi:hypothetical protein
LYLMDIILQLTMAYWRVVESVWRWWLYCKLSSEYACVDRGMSISMRLGDGPIAHSSFTDEFQHSSVKGIEFITVPALSD